MTLQGNFTKWSEPLPEPAPGTGLMKAKNGTPGLTNLTVGTYNQSTGKFEPALAFADVRSVGVCLDISSSIN